MSVSQKIKREIVWYHKDDASRGDKMIGRAPLRSFNLGEVQRLWNVPEDNPMVDSFEITVAQAEAMQEFCDIQFDFKRFDYFLEASADD